MVVVGCLSMRMRLVEDAELGIVIVMQPSFLDGSSSDEKHGTSNVSSGVRS